MENKEKINDILMQENIKDSIERNIEFLIMMIPEIRTMIGFDHRHPHHHLDVYGHTIEALNYSSSDLEVRMALLLHDIGKPFSYQEGEIRHFYRHPEVSAQMTKQILERLEYDEDFINDVYYLVKEHDTPIEVDNLDNTMDLIKKRLEVQFADARAHHPDKIAKRLELLNEIKERIDRIEEREQCR